MTNKHSIKGTTNEEIRVMIDAYYFNLDHEDSCPRDVEIFVESTPGSGYSKRVSIRVCEMCRCLYDEVDEMTLPVMSEKKKYDICKAIHTV